MNPFQNLSFIISAGRVEELPPPAEPELVFAGRSNVGKSSAINALANRRRLAFVSKTPGRTQTINIFHVPDRLRLVDLPGYGYARVPKSVRAGWDLLVGGYLANRPGIAAVVLVMDARHPMTTHDRELLDWLKLTAGTTRRVLGLLAKADKLTRREAATTCEGVARQLAETGLDPEVLLFSSLSGQGVEETRALLLRWADAARRLDSGPPEIKNPRQRGGMPGAKMP